MHIIATRAITFFTNNRLTIEIFFKAAPGLATDNIKYILAEELTKHINSSF